MNFEIRKIAQKMKLAIFVLTLILVTEALESDIHAKWESHKQKHNKTFRNREHETLSKEKFFKVDKMIEEHNRHAAAGKVGYYVAHNQFSDDISENVDIKHKGFIYNENNHREYLVPIRKYIYSRANIPESFDWREHGWNVPVRNQGKCGACWAFSTTASMEAQIFKKHKRIITLSTQELIDCSAIYGTSGCESGSLEGGFNYIYDNGVTEEALLPYMYYNNEFNDRICPSDIYNKKRYKITDVTTIQSGDIQSLREAIFTKGPLSISIDSSLQSFKNYQGGVYTGHEMFNGQRTGIKCSSKTDHNVLLIGYGVTTKGRRYWIIKNQWGTEWGENGYMRLLDDGSDICGITDEVLIPEVI